MYQENSSWRISSLCSSSVNSRKYITLYFPTFYLPHTITFNKYLNSKTPLYLLLISIKHIVEHDHHNVIQSICCIIQTTVKAIKKECFDSLNLPLTKVIFKTLKATLQKQKRCRIYPPCRHFLKMKAREAFDYPWCQLIYREQSRNLIWI